MVRGHVFAHVIALMASTVLFTGCTSSDEDTISRKVPRGYQRAHKITTDSWEAKADGAMSVAELEAPAEAMPAEPSPMPEKWEPAAPSLISKIRNKSVRMAKLTYRTAKRVARVARGKRKPRMMAENTSKGIIR